MCVNVSVYVYIYRGGGVCVEGHSYSISVVTCGDGFNVMVLFRGGVDLQSLTFVPESILVWATASRRGCSRLVR